MRLLQSGGADGSRDGGGGGMLSLVILVCLVGGWRKFNKLEEGGSGKQENNIVSPVRDGICLRS